jgi:hypothetical protein
MEPFFLMHLLFMSLGVFLMAAGVVTVRYYRKKTGWFRLHKMLGLLSTVLLGAGGIAAVSMVYREEGGTHFDVPHTWVGGFVIVLMIGTLAAGFAQTRVLNKKRMRLVHRSAGRTVVVLALVAVIMGAIAAGIIPGP